MSNATAITIFTVVGFVVGGPIAAIIFGLLAWIAFKRKPLQ